jgi:hypothetical protein
MVQTASSANNEGIEYLFWLCHWVRHACSTLLIKETDTRASNISRLGYNYISMIFYYRLRLSPIVRQNGFMWFVVSPDFKL